MLPDMTDPFAAMKQKQRELWASFAPTAAVTTPAAGHLVRFAGIVAGERVLDVGTGTGVAAITAARAGATVSGLDLTPVLLEAARDNARIAGCEVAWTEGDAEALPYESGTFDVVLSQFGHIFAPRPDVAIAEMRRVLKPTGRVAFATWQPEFLIGKVFAFTARHAPPPPPGAATPWSWGVPSIIAERLAAGFGAPFFEHGELHPSQLSLGHFREMIERSVGPIERVVASLAGDPPKLAQFRAELEAIAAPFFHDNVMQQDYLLTRAHAR
jgi:SAM-dependent methyltransferase